MASKRLLIIEAARAVVLGNYTLKEAHAEFGVLMLDLREEVDRQRVYLDPAHIKKKKMLQEAWCRSRRAKEMIK